MSNVAPAEGGQGGAAIIAAPPASEAPVPSVVTTPADWTHTLADDDRGWIQNKGWKDPADAVRGYRELEKLRGVPADRLLKLPEKADDPAWAEVHAKLGRPEKPEDYGIDTGDKDYDARITALMHSKGVSKEAAKAIESERTAYMAERVEAAQKAWEQADQLEAEAVLKEWGAGADGQTEIARRYARQMGLDGEQLTKLNAAMGSGWLMRFMAKAGASLGEAEFVGSNGAARFGMTPEAAKSRMAELKADPEWSAKYLEGNADANAEMKRLIAYANGQRPE